MNDKKILQGKDTIGEWNFANTPTVLPTSVTVCLAAHEECSGSYTDNKGQFLLRCGCACHSNMKEGV